MNKLAQSHFAVKLDSLLFLTSTQEIVPAHLMTSPITTEEALFTSREIRCGGSGPDNSQPLSPEDLTSGSVQTCSNTVSKKRKKRRKKHKAEPRKEEHVISAGGEVELCELSSDEESAHNCHWLVNSLKAVFICKLELNLIPVFRASSLSMTKDNMDHRHSPVTALEWDSYPFSDGDWSPCTMYDFPALPICIVLTNT